MAASAAAAAAASDDPKANLMHLKDVEIQKLRNRIGILFRNLFHCLIWALWNTAGCEVLLTFKIKTNMFRVIVQDLVQQEICAERSRLEERRSDAKTRVQNRLAARCILASTSCCGVYLVQRVQLFETVATGVRKQKNTDPPPQSLLPLLETAVRLLMRVPCQVLQFGDFCGVFWLVGRFGWVRYSYPCYLTFWHAEIRIYSLVLISL